MVKNLQKLLLLQTQRQVSTMHLPFNLAFPAPTEASQPTCRCHSMCPFLLHPTTCPSPTGWPSARAQLPTALCLWHIRHLCPSLSQSSAAGPTAAKSLCRIQVRRRGFSKSRQSRLTAPTPQKWCSCCSNLIWWRCSHACAREEKVKRDCRHPGLRIFYLLS